jgi:cytochrome c oxidase cbb3-type subunit IV
MEAPVVRELMKYLDASFCAEAALVLFLGVFFAVTVRALLSRSNVAREQAAIPLSDGQEVSRS